MRSVTPFLLCGGLLTAAGVLGCPMPGNGGTPDPAKSFAATFSGDREVPPVVSDGTGTGTFTLNDDETELTFQITASGLSGPVIAAHFHYSAAGAAASGPIVFDITNTVTESNGQVSATGVWPLSAQDVADIRAGYIYVNLHTELHPPGEIRGNLVPAQ